ncbi:MAG: acetate--CoA ligase [Gammaproteobacteria bacterium]
MSKPDSEFSEAEIAVHWKEEPLIPPPAEFIGQANMTDPAVFERMNLEHFPECYREYADLLSWRRYWTQIFDGSQAPFWRWFVGGEINACYNCVDRHLEKNRNKAALYFVPDAEGEPTTVITYQDLWVKVNEFAALLRDFCHLKRGDRVTLHMPMAVESVVTMLACARLGVIHSQVFSGFSGKACADRIVDSRSRVLITMDAYYRAGKLLDHKEKADVAVSEAHKQGQKVDQVLVWQRHPGKHSAATPMVKNRDYAVNEVLAKYRRERVACERLPATDPLFLMYSSGTTGKPKGCQHSIGGYLAWAAGTTKYVLDVQPEDVYWCMADIGWITGHSYIVYGPLALGASSVLYEGVPNYPDAGRPWRIAEELGVNIFHTSPTAVRALRREGPDEPAKYNYHFKLMCTVGEPIEPESWRWYYNSVGKGKAVIVDTWWQTENGGHLISTLPALGAMKAGSAGLPLPGVHPVIYDENGEELAAGSGRAGNLCIRNPWPGLMQTIWGDPDRYVKTYFERYCKNKQSKNWQDWPYFSGDGAMQASDAYIRVLGRIDDVINVAGHRLGTKEIESAAMTVTEIAEAAVVPVPDEIKGRVPEIYVSVKPGVKADEALAQRVSKAIETEISPIARPRRVWIVPDMPKTRSGKIMRRVLAALSTGRDPGDITTLANPEVVEKIRKQLAQR